MVLLVLSYEHPRARLRRPAARPGGDLGDRAGGAPKLAALAVAAVASCALAGAALAGLWARALVDFPLHRPAESCLFAVLVSLAFGAQPPRTQGDG